MLQSPWSPAQVRVGHMHIPAVLLVYQPLVTVRVVVTVCRLGEMVAIFHRPACQRRLGAVLLQESLPRRGHMQALAGVRTSHIWGSRLESRGVTLMQKRGGAANPADPESAFPPPPAFSDEGNGARDCSSDSHSVL